MSLCLACADEREKSCSDVSHVDCSCDLEKIGVLRAYMQEQFPGRVVHEFHSHSTEVRDGRQAACAEHHVVTVGDECPYCAVLTSEFLEQPLETLGQRLHQWSLASTLRAERTVIVGAHGVSPV